MCSVCPKLSEMNRLDLIAITGQVYRTCRKIFRRRPKKSTTDEKEVEEGEVVQAQPSDVHGGHGHRIASHGSQHHHSHHHPHHPPGGHGHRIASHGSQHHYPHHPPQHTSTLSHITIGDVVRDENRGSLLPVIICVNIVILGCALVSGSAFNHVAISAIHRQIFLIVLVCLTAIWMMYYMLGYAHRKDRVVHYKDHHASPVWIKGGLVLFGLLSLIMDVFKIAKYVGYLHCDSAVKIVFPAVQAIFILLQTYYFCVHAKDCVQLQKNLTRCGLMLTLSTNLVFWIAAVTEESLHQTVLPETAKTTNATNATKLSMRSLIARGSQEDGQDDCKCSHSGCGIFEEAYYYLYPFNIEYSLFASAMAYVMWKNVGRLVDEPHHQHRFSLRDASVGPVVGVALVLAGLVTFVLYEKEVTTEDRGRRDAALTMHYVMNLVAVTLMSVCTVIGCVVYSVDRRDRVSGENPTLSLDVILLVGASMGQLTIDYFTIVAVVATGAEDVLDALSLSCSLLTAVQLALQNIFLIEGFRREPFHETHPATRHHGDVELCDVDFHALQADHADMVNFQDTVTEARDVYIAPRKHSLTWKRRLLKEICAFLLLANVILWIMPAFGARPQFDHTLGTDFYKFTMWTAVVNIGLPFGIFYRMHSIASLVEVFMTS